MSKKTIKQRARAGETVGGTFIFECFTPGIAKIAENAGCEFIVYDMEHTGLSLETLKGLYASTRGLAIAPMARVPRGEYHFIARALDIGMHGVMVPMVESAEQARAIAEAAHYPPDGRRGAAFGFVHDDYSGGDLREKMQRLAARNLVIAQIETERGLANVEAIAEVPGIDVLWVGHFDLTNFLGIPGEFENPRYLKALKRVVSAGRKHKKGLGFMATDAGFAERYRDHGFNMIASGHEPGILTAGIKAILAPLKGMK